MFRTDLLSIIRSLNTVYTAIGIYHTVMLTVNIINVTNTYCCVYSVETPEEGQQIFSKHVDFFTKINLRNGASRRLLLQELIKKIIIKWGTTSVIYRLSESLRFIQEGGLVLVYYFYRVWYAHEFMCLNKTYSGLQIDSSLLTSSITSSLTQGGAPSQLKFSFFHAIKQVQENQEGLKLKGAYQFPVYAHDGKLLGESKHTVTKKGEVI